MLDIIQNNVRKHQFIGGKAATLPSKNSIWKAMDGRTIGLTGF